MMSLRRKEKLIHTLRWIVKGRWVIIFGILAVGLAQRTINVVSIHLPSIYMITLALTAIGYNVTYYLLLRRGMRLSDWTLRIIALAQVFVDQILFTYIIYLSGSSESLSFIFYFFPILIATVLFRNIGILLFAFINSLFYISIIAIEINDSLPFVERYDFISGIHGNVPVMISNTFTIVAVIMLAAFFSTYISNMIRDREREILNEQDKINAILNSLPDGVIMIDATGKVVALNPQGAEMLQVKATAIIGSILMKENFISELQELGAYIIQQSSYTHIESKEIEVEERGMRRVYKITSIPVFNTIGKIIGSMKVITDYTRERELDRMKSDFISIAAHQLRTPLSGVKWLLKMIIDGDMGPLNEEQKRFLQRGYQNQERMIALINDLLDVSRIEEGRFQFNMDSCQIEESITESMRLVEGLAQKKNIQLRFTAPEKPLSKITCDKEKIALVLQNLLDNAIKYTKNEGHVLVHVAQEGNMITTSIQDNGVGIPQDQQKKLFSKFFRARNVMQMHTDGSGLGLFIVRNIVNTHGGAVGVESEEGKGTKVWFSLPLNRVA